MKNAFRTGRIFLESSPGKRKERRRKGRRREDDDQHVREREVGKKQGERDFPPPLRLRLFGACFHAHISHHANTVLCCVCVNKC